MSDIPASNSIGWEISARPGGDVLAARARGHGIELMLLSRSAGHDPVQIEAWLAELIGVAVETSRNDPADRPISTLLRHALTGLLFSHAELWHHTPDDPPCSLAFVTTNDRVAFGWAGPAEVELWVDDQPSEGPIVRVRDRDGREAQAIEVESWRRVRVRLAWRAGAGSGATATVDLEGAWPGRPALPSGQARSASTPETIPEWRTPSWLGQQAPWEQAASSPSGPEAEAAWRPKPFMQPSVQPPAQPPAQPPVQPPAQAPVQPFVQSSMQPRPAELRPMAPSPPSVPTGPEPLTPMTAEERAAEVAPDEPEPPKPAQPQPLEIIRPMEPGPTVAPPADMEIIRLPVPVEGLQTRTRISPGPTPQDTSAPPATPAMGAPPWVEPAPPAGATPPSTDPASAAVGATLWSEAPAADRSTPPWEVPATTVTDLDPALTAWASRSAHSPLRPARVRRPAWPAAEEPQRPWWKRRTPVVTGVLVLFAVGWLLGGLPSSHGDRGPGFFARVLARVGLGPAHYQVMVDSHPQGAWISLDGHETARRTPATLEVKPGAHQVTLSFAELGHATYQVDGGRDARVTLDAVLWGSLVVSSMDHSVAVKVSVDGAARGLAPVTVDSLAPGVHQVQFWSPGAGSWNQIVEVRVRETAEVAARPFASPATGVLEVRATESGASGPQPVSGATVWLDGENRGVTPLSLDLPRGPHSVRLAYRGQDSPVQLIDLPGGNQRFARFDLDAGDERARLRVPAPGRLSLEAPTVISAALEGVAAPDVREMWLHVSTPEGQWRRYAMNVLKAPGGAVGAAVFPVVQLDRRGRARFYVSAATRSGDELFSEIQTALGPSSANAASTP